MKWILITKALRFEYSSLEIPSTTFASIGQDPLPESLRSVVKIPSNSFEQWKDHEGSLWALRCWVSPILLSTCKFRSSTKFSAPFFPPFFSASSCTTFSCASIISFVLSIKREALLFRGMLSSVFNSAVLSFSFTFCAAFIASSRTFFAYET